MVGSIVSVNNARRQPLEKCVKSEGVPYLHQRMMSGMNPCVFTIQRGQGKNRGPSGTKETEGRTINQIFELRGTPPLSGMHNQS
jgi:hypothetical protein